MNLCTLKFLNITYREMPCCGVESLFEPSILKVLEKTLILGKIEAGGEGDDRE